MSSAGKASHRSVASLDKVTLEHSIEKLARMAKELRGFDVSTVADRSDSRLEGLQRKANNLLGEIVSVSGADYKKYAVARLDASLDRTFGDHYSIDEYRDAVKQGIGLAIVNLNAFSKLLSDQVAEGAGSTAPAQTPPPPPSTLPPTPQPTQPPTPAPTLAPTSAPPPSPSPSPTPSSSPAPASTTMNKPSSTHSPASSTGPSGNRVIVMGDGDASADAVEFLGNLGMEPAVLDVPSVEKLDALRDAAYAVVLPAADCDASALMLAVGFMLAALGRSRICLLAPADQALPPALEGATRIAPDPAGGWHLVLAREMKRAGMEVDLNRLL